jgi:hypothetical protein
MRRALSASLLALSAAFVASSASATVRSFAYTQESGVLAAGRSELQPWTTFRAGRSRYYSALDGRLELGHGLTRGLQVALFWNFRTETQDVEADSLTRALSRVTSSEFASASAQLRYQLSDVRADAVGSALAFETTLGPHESELAARVIVDRSIGPWLVAGNAIAELRLLPLRDDSGSRLHSALVLSPTLGAAYVFSPGASLGLELRAPLGVSGEGKSAAVFGGPVARIADDSMWATLGVEPQLLAFSGKSEGSRLALGARERLEVRLMAGFLL